MKLFGQLIRTAVNVAILPVEVAKDVITLGKFGEGIFGDEKTYTREQLEKIAREAEEEEGR